jgi:hypothetical protein
VTRLLQLLEEARGVRQGVDVAWGRARAQTPHGVGWGHRRHVGRAVRCVQRPRTLCRRGHLSGCPGVTVLELQKLRQTEFRIVYTSSQCPEVEST